MLRNASADGGESAVEKAALSSENEELRRQLDESKAALATVTAALSTEVDSIRGVVKDSQEREDGATAAAQAEVTRLQEEKGALLLQLEMLRNAGADGGESAVEKAALSSENEELRRQLDESKEAFVEAVAALSGELDLVRGVVQMSHERDVTAVATAHAEVSRLQEENLTLKSDLDSTLVISEKEKGDLEDKLARAADDAFAARNSERVVHLAEENEELRRQLDECKAALFTTTTALSSELELVRAALVQGGTVMDKAFANQSAAELDRLRDENEALRLEAEGKRVADKQVLQAEFDDKHAALELDRQALRAGAEALTSAVHAVEQGTAWGKANSTRDDHLHQGLLDCTATLERVTASLGTEMASIRTAVTTATAASSAPAATEEKVAELVKMNQMLAQDLHAAQETLQEVTGHLAAERDKASPLSVLLALVKEADGQALSKQLEDPLSSVIEELRGRVLVCESQMGAVYDKHFLWEEEHFF